MGCDECALTGTPTVKFGLYEVKVHLDARRHAVDDAAHAGAVALAESGEAVNVSECVHCAERFRGWAARRAEVAVVCVAR